MFVYTESGMTPGSTVDICISKCYLARFPSLKEREVHDIMSAFILSSCPRNSFRPIIMNASMLIISLETTSLVKYLISLNSLMVSISKITRRTKKAYKTETIHLLKKETSPMYSFFVEMCLFTP
jgi:hypothetical protein